MSEYKAILNADGTFRGLVPINANTAPEQTRTWVPTVAVVGEGEIAEPDEPLIDETTATQRWKVRPMSDAEAQKVSTQLILWKKLSAIERRKLWNLANADDTALLVLGAMWSATETESRNPETKALLGASMQLGVVADIERAREILDDPGFTLE